MKQFLFISADDNKLAYSWNYVTNRVIDDGVNVGFVLNSSLIESPAIDSVNAPWRANSVLTNYLKL